MRRLHLRKGPTSVGKLRGRITTELVKSDRRKQRKRMHLKSCLPLTNPCVCHVLNPSPEKCLCPVLKKSNPVRDFNLLFSFFLWPHVREPLTQSKHCTSFVSLKNELQLRETHLLKYSAFVFCPYVSPVVTNALRQKSSIG